MTITTMYEQGNAISWLSRLFRRETYGPVKLIAAGIADDEGLIDTWEKRKTYLAVSDRGTYSVLKRNYLDSFLDFDIAREHTAVMAAGGGLLASRALTLAAAFASGIRIKAPLPQRTPKIMVMAALWMAPASCSS